MAKNGKKDQSLDQVRLLVSEQNVHGLVEILLEEDARGLECVLALDGLLEINNTQAWDAIGEVLTVNETVVVERMIDQLAVSHVPGAVRALGCCLSNPNMLLRSQAMRALSRNWNPTTMPHLLRASRDPAKSIARGARRCLEARVHEYPTIMTEIREATAEGIMEFLDLEWAMHLASDSYPDNIRAMAIGRIGEIGGEGATQCLIALAQVATDELGETCWRALEACQDLTDFLMLPLLVHENPAIKARALRKYSQIVGADGADLLEGLTADADPDVRKSALLGIARLRGNEAIPKLFAALKDEDEGVQMLALSELSRIPDSSPELVDAATFFKGEIRRLALIALAKRGIVVDSLMPYYFEFLMKGAGCTDTTQVDYLDAINIIAKALAENHNPEGLIVFTGLGRSIIRRIRRTAIEAIMAYPPEDRVDALHSLEDSEDRDILRNVADGLHEVRDQRAVMPLIRVCMTLRGRPMLRAREALKEYSQVDDIEFLLGALKSRWAAVRQWSAQRLAELKDPASVPGLLEASHDEDVEVQLAVVEALGPFATDEERVVERMLEVVALGDVSVKQAACEALGEARCKAAVPALIKALHNYFLRPRAEMALKMIGDRKGYLAIKRLERREKMFPKKPRDVILAKKRAAI